MRYETGKCEWWGKQVAHKRGKSEACIQVRGFDAPLMLLGFLTAHPAPLLIVNGEEDEQERIRAAGVQNRLPA